MRTKGRTQKERNGEDRKGKGSNINERTPKQTARTETNVRKWKVVTSAISSA